MFTPCQERRFRGLFLAPAVSLVLEVPPFFRGAVVQFLRVTITSNIQGVLDRAIRRSRDVHTALERTLSVAGWDKLMREEAKRTLWALAKQSEWGFVDTFVATVLTGPFMTGFFARMTNPVPRVLEVQDFADARYLQTRALQSGTGPMLWSEFVNQFDQMMTDWVANEKDKDKRDYEKSDEEIGGWIGYLMLTPDAKLSAKRSGRVNPVTGKEDMSELEAKKSLMPHIVDYIQRRQTDNRLSNDKINAWLLAVLAAWSALVRREFPVRLREHLKLVRTEL